MQGYSVRAFVYYNSFNSWGWLDTLSQETLEQIEIFAGDIRDPNGVREAMKGVDAVYHLAALIGIPFSYHSPDSYIDTNIKGTLNVLQAARDNKVSRILCTSTSEVYGTAQYVPIDEKHPKQPQSPYSASKIGADSIAESFYRAFDLPVTIVRPFNTYGPRQSARAFIPTVITQLLDGADTLQLGDLSPTRDLLFVQDTAEAFEAIANCQTLVGEECNIATNSEHTIATVVDTLVAAINPNAKIELDPQRIRPAKSEVFRLFGDNTKLMEHTQWKPKYDLARGLQETIAWFSEEENRKGYKSNIYNV